MTNELWPKPINLSLHEAVYEDESLKQSVFEEVEKICPAHCILASGTSGILI